MPSISTLKRLQIAPGLWLDYQDQGGFGTPVVFLHGLGSSHSTWQKNITELANHFHCLAPDLPGYGSTSNLQADYTIDLYSKTILRLINILGLDQVSLVGHSMGAQVAMKTTLLAPDKVKKLVLIAPAGFERFSPAETRWLKNLYQPEILHRIPVSEFIKNIKSNFYDAKNMEADFMETYLDIYQSENYGVYCSTLCNNIRSMLEDPIFERLEDIKIPSLVIFGQNDQMIPNRLLHPELSTRKIAEVAAAKIENSTLEMIDHAGHFVHWERSAQVNQFLLTFLK